RDIFDSIKPRIPLLFSKPNHFSDGVCKYLTLEQRTYIYDTVIRPSPETFLKNLAGLNTILSSAFYTEQERKTVFKLVKDYLFQWDVKATIPTISTLFSLLDTEDRSTAFNLLMTELVSKIKSIDDFNLIGQYLSDNEKEILRSKKRDIIHLKEK